MPERPTPDIPQYLRDSLPSAASYEEGLRRDYQIRVRAWDLGIPEASLQNPTVYRYASVLRDVDVAPRRDDMRDPYLRTLRAVPAPLPGSEAGARLTQYRLLNLLSDTLLTEGFPGRTHHASDVGRSLDYLVKPLGTIAENVFEHEKYTPAVSVSGTWSHRDAGEHRFPDNEVEGEGSGRRDSSWWSRPDTLLERDDPEHLALIDAETRRQGINPRSHRANEAYASMSRLVYARQLEEEAAGVADLLPAPGLEPSAPDRLVRVAPLLVLATRTLGEQFHPGQLAPDEVLTVLEPVARSIGRRIL